ncbi:MAG: hypothetical protein H7837_12065 [Magnetococcus sp. MYC-9]
MHADSPCWDCRWPDPIALTVATERIARGCAPEDPRYNRRLGIRVQLDPHDEQPTVALRALLVTPWAVERVYWHDPNQAAPPIRHAFPLTADMEGRVAAGLGVILSWAGQQIPVLTAWEPEVGHHFVETLLPSVQDLGSVEEAIAVALGRKPLFPVKRSVTDHLSSTVSRRNLLGLLGR